MSVQDLNLTPSRPYMVRAIYEWLEDNMLTPYLLIDATQDNLIIPTEYVQEGQIVLNIASQATGGLNIDNDFISFSARFGGVSRDLWVPMHAVMGIYSKENSQGMFFDPSEYENYTPNENNKSTTDTGSAPNKPKRENKAGLKVLK